MISTQKIMSVINGVLTALILLLVCVHLYSQSSKPDYSAGTAFNSNNDEQQNEVLPNLTVNHGDIGSFDEYIEITERPIFNKDRRPFVLSKAKIAEKLNNDPNKAKANEKVQLSATVITPDKHITLLQSAPNKKATRFSIGEQISGWTVVEVHPHHILLERDGETKTIELNIATSKANKNNNKKTPARKAPQLRSKPERPNEEAPRHPELKVDRAI